MPWNHCGKHIMDDINACPICGQSKRAWTIRMDRTRAFQLSGWTGDVSTQIEALENAAENGTPFCEKCEKARIARAEGGGG